MPRHIQLLIALVIGTLLGLLLYPYSHLESLQWVNSNVLQVIGQIFLRLLFMIVVPLIFSALVLGVFELGKSHGLGRVASRTLLFTIIASSISVLVGTLFVNVIKPGAYYQIKPELIASQSAELAAISSNAQKGKPAAQSIIELIPKNPLDTASRALNGEMIPFMIFALIFGLALALTLGKKNNQSEDPTIIQVFDQILKASMKIVDFAMIIAPIGVFAIVFNTIFKHGYGVLTSLGLFILVVVGGLLFQQLVVYSILLKTFTKWSPWQFMKATREPLLYAFSTASSNATLPLTLETAEKKLKLPPQISRFVLTVGATANQNGSGMYEGVTVLFLAQVYGIDLTLMQQITVVFTAILAGVGTAGVPGGTLPMIAVLLQNVGIPAEGLGLILGVDRFLDMCRTTLNVSGDLVIAALVSGDQKKS